MAQVTDRNIGANPTGFDMRTEINNIIAALESDNSGSSAPLNTVAYMKWLDTSNATYYYYKERNHDNTAWVTLFRYTVATKIMEAVSNGVVLSQTNIAREIHASSSKTTPVDADEVGLIDSDSTFTLKKLTWLNLKNTLKTYFDTLYVALTGTQTIDGIKTFSSSPIVPTPTTDFQASTKKYTDDSLLALTFEKIVQGTVVNSTSGTSIDFTGIPSWAKKITVMFNGVSTSGTSVVQVQLGSTVIQNTGYSAMAGYGTAAGQYSILTTGFPIEGTNAAIAATNRFGLLLLCNLTTNVWCETTNIYSANVTNNFGSGGVTLSGTLGRIRITTVNGTDTFDAGQINIMYEG